MTADGPEVQADPPPAPPAEPSLREGRATRRLIVSLSALAALMSLLLVVRAWVLTPFRIPTPSMEPTLFGGSREDSREGDTILVNRLAYIGSSPSRWDVVAFRSVEPPASKEPANPAVVKRVVGLPGEEVVISGGEIHVNGGLVAKPPALRDIHYIDSGSYGWSPLVLGPEEYFVLGDNTARSWDSRRFGPLPRGNIFGRVDWIILPLSRWGRVR